MSISCLVAITWTSPLPLWPRASWSPDRLVAGGSTRCSAKRCGRQCSAVKERLLAEDAPERVAITVLGTGRTVVGGAMTTELTREEALAVLNEFLPLVGADERPQRQVRRGLRELGLPYESDPAVTRHLAAFLARAARISGDVAADSSRAAMIRPDAVLFNGGFFTPPVARERILDALAFWFGERPSVLENDAPEAAVAIGAAFYAAIRRAATAASRLLIRAGSARAYYVAVQSIEAPGITTAVCVMPRGTSEGTARGTRSRVHRGGQPARRIHAAQLRRTV